jgi:Flp pilus assembly pilin Flp
MILYTLNYVRALLGLAREDDGVTSVEYAIMVSAIALVVLVGAGLLGAAVDGLFTTAAGKVVTP